MRLRPEYPSARSGRRDRRLATCGWRCEPGPRATETKLPPPAPAGEGMPASGGGTFPRMLQVEIGGGYRAGDLRLAACFRAHASAPAGFRAGRLMRPGIHFRRKFRRNLHSVLRITCMTKQIIIISRALCQPDPPPEYPLGPAVRTSGDQEKRSVYDNGLPEKPGERLPPSAGTRTPSRRRARTGNFMKSRARKESLASGPSSPLRRPGPSADPDPRAGSFD